MNFIKVNKLILKAINSQDKDIFCDVMETFIKEKVITGIFKKKYYLWNIIRPRDVYKLIAYWIETTIDCDDSDTYNLRIDIMHELILTTKNIKIRKSFVWGLLKRVNILTIYTIQYASSDKIFNIISKLNSPDQRVYVDNILYPLMMSVKTQFESYKSDINLLNEMLEL